MATSKQIKMYMTANNATREEAEAHFKGVAASLDIGRYEYETGYDYKGDFSFLPERLWVIVTGETEVVEFTYLPMMFKNSTFAEGLSSELSRATIATLLGRRLNRPELGMNSIMQVENATKIVEVANMIMGYIGTSEWLGKIDYSKFKKPCVLLSNFKLENGQYGLQKVGMTEFPNDYYHSDYEDGGRNIGVWTNIDNMRPEIISGMYVGHNRDSIKGLFKDDVKYIHPDSYILRALGLRRKPSVLNVVNVSPVKTDEHASGWHWTMTQETKDKISAALTGMRYKTASREGIEWNWVDGKKEWISAVA